MSDKEVCRKVLEKILNVSIREVSMPATKKTINMLYDGKVIRLDVYLNDDEGTVYHVEMERGKQKKAFVIFICTFDPFGEQRHMYTFENRCRENPSLTLGDETARIFLNTRGNMQDVDPEMQEFLSYVENTTDDFASQARSPLIKEIHKKVTEVKKSKEIEVEYMTLLQRDRKNIELGREEGHKEGTLYATKILKMYNKGMNFNDIASSLNLDPQYVNSVISDYESN